MKPALEGVRVVAFETGASGPLCSRILADHGADVIKIERPVRGDVSREWDSIAKGLSCAFVWLNRNKRSLTLNITQKEGRDILFNLISQADVFLQNFAPETAEKLQLGYESVKHANPDIIYCGISGYGKDGPYKNMKAYDLVMQGETGLISLTGYPDKPAKIALSICDIAGGMYAAQAILLALYQREKTGGGQEIHVSLFESVLSWLGYFPYFWWYRREKPQREGMRHQLLTPYGPYLTRDSKYVNFAVLSNQDWEVFCKQVIRRPDLLEDHRFRNNEDRVKHRRQLESLIEDIIAGESQDEWLSRLNASGLPYGRVNDIEEVLKHPQTAHLKLVQEIETAVGKIKVIDSPLRMSKAPSVVRNVPALGQDTKDILRKLGYTDRQISRFRAEGVV
ncbi:MAG: CaiB/BaiF CoA transferase family protein [Candidatus Bathyarchaeia archaeon]